MNDRDSFWRRTFGIYLSAVPDAAGETSSESEDRPAVSPISPKMSNSARRDVVLLGEALDLVTVTQGYQTPALPPLLKALIRDIRTLDLPIEQTDEETPTAQTEADAEANSVAEDDSGSVVGSEAAKSDEAGKTDAASDTARPEPSAGSDGEAAGDGEYADLQGRVAAADQKLAALTGAVGQLVDLLQRRSVSNGAVDRRKAPRVSGQNAKIFVHDRAHEVVNWSQDGFLIRISDADRFSRRGFDFHFVLDLPDETVEFQGRAAPVRIERDTLAAQFSILDETTRSKMGQIVASFAADGSS